MWLSSKAEQARQPRSARPKPWQGEYECISQNHRDVQRAVASAIGASKPAALAPKRGALPDTPCAMAHILPAGANAPTSQEAIKPAAVPSVSA